eukprot:TRINITY_DN3152_c0_g1_i7.p2 TRINITY_DN3152_c0_g1~~TRINITY_DN3152_c0_g1_i7.p2  ORF type:complete len:104 (-),score=0.81 TRINITY_DN3152_c0_g1_i7:145-456(-)
MNVIRQQQNNKGIKLDIFQICLEQIFVVIVGRNFTSDELFGFGINKEANFLNAIQFHVQFPFFTRFYKNKKYKIQRNQFLKRNLVPYLITFFQKMLQKIQNIL